MVFWGNRFILTVFSAMVARLSSAGNATSFPSIGRPSRKARKAMQYTWM